MNHRPATTRTLLGCLILLSSLPLAGTAAWGARPEQPREPSEQDAAPLAMVLEDWIRQDHGSDVTACFTSSESAKVETAMLDRVLDELDDLDASGNRNVEFRAKQTAFLQADLPGNGAGWKDLYVAACRCRRELRLHGLVEKYPRIVFTKHYDMGGSHYAYTEGQSDAQHERYFVPGSALCLLEFDGPWATARTLVEDLEGVIRDPDVSHDGRRILFAWKKSDRLDDYHLHEMDAQTGAVRQLTFGLGFADYEGVYLPSGDLLFTSTRCVQIVDCWWTEVSNLYRCNAHGDYLRRVSFDQVHANYPQVLGDGRVVYTRWDYNDRGQIYPQPLFQMNSDGTGQREFYGNNSWFPTTILHARGIAGTGKVVAVLSGHHCHQRGKLAIIDPSAGRQEAAGVQLIAPLRQTPAQRIDAYGQDGDQFQYPYPVSETEFVVTYDPVGGGNRQYARPYGIYWMSIDGRRELLAWDPDVSSSQPVPLEARPKPPLRPRLDYRQTTGTYYVQDVYAGEGLAGIPRDTIERLRVVALDFRAAGVGQNGSRGPAGGALSSTPVSIGNGCWDVKIVLGDAKVYADGSACFTVPAQTPVYFQALDENGHAVQTMRSWSTLQPGESRSCVGCHESKNEAALHDRPGSMALTAGPQPLEPFYGPPRGFSFINEVQPILDRHCVGCHHDRSQVGPSVDSKPASEEPSVATQRKNPSQGNNPAEKTAFSLLGTQNIEQKSGRRWSDAYLALTGAGRLDQTNKGTLSGRPTELVNWISVQSEPHMLPPYHQGAATSRLIDLLCDGHYDVELTGEEMDKIACWIDLLVPYCGDYTEANAWSQDDRRKYAHFLAKRRRMEVAERRNVEALLASVPARSTPVARSNASNASNATDVADVAQINGPRSPYRNLAANPAGRQGEADGYPQASSNSEYNDLAWFAARCAIDGHTENRGHGKRYPSWSPHKRTDLWWKLEFGRKVIVDKLVLHIRADFSHDAYWHAATIEFSDGSRETIEILKTAKRQPFVFEKRSIEWLRLVDLVQEEPLGWCGLAEVEVWGIDSAMQIRD